MALDYTFLLFGQNVQGGLDTCTSIFEMR